MNQSLIAKITEHEIKDAVFQLGRLKALRPNSFSRMSFQEIWEEVKVDVINFMRDFYRNEKMDPYINKTIISLLPKVKKIKKEWRNIDRLAAAASSTR